MPKKRRASLRLHKHERHHAPPAHATPRSWFRDAHGHTHRDLDVAALTHAVNSGEGLLWVDVQAESAEQRALLANVFKFHPLSIEDTTSAEGRVKVEEFPSYCLVVVRGVRFVAETEDLYDIETFNLWTFVGRNFVVTVHGPHAPGVDAAIDRLSRDPSLLERGPGRLMHHILDATVDAYFPIIDQLDEFVDGLEERVFVHFDQEALRDIFSVKRLVLTLRRHLSPMREVFNVLQSRPSPHVSPEAQVYFRDVYDHVIRLNENLDTYRDLLSSTLDSYLTQISNRMGMVTKGLTVVATLSVPFVVVSGMWGMNFAHIPLSDWPHGFWVMLAVQLGLGGGLVWLLRRNGWL
ncbi:MAG: magnesium and cobalt transport protein CorA [Gemmatimonas sp.]|nr:magnesium and cobalt transport protein CorA [Gemmatimonas sp.]